MLVVCMALVGHACQRDIDLNDTTIIQDFACEAPDVIEFVLPFSIGSSFQLIQGNCSSSDHSGVLRYAFDFEMPIGTIIVAAQTGIVNAVEQGYSDQSNNYGQENVIFIEHENGTFGRYLHLTKDGAMVKPGDLVLQGQPIGWSGNSGFSRTPHLHFDVIRCLTNCGDVETVAIGFINAEVPVPHERKHYTANPY